MTLIITHISKYGIIHASDSNLTTPTSYAGAGKKVFKIPNLNAALSLAGTYQVNNVRMDEWMESFIETHSSGNISLGNFAKTLKQALQDQMLPDEKTGTLIHIAGYVEENGNSHPELWFVRNIYSMENGEYGDVRPEFQVTEDFWGRDYEKNNLKVLFEQGGYQLYINGFASGRISYNILQSALQEFFKFVWSYPAWKFRAPKSIAEREAFIKLNFQFIHTLFLSSDYLAPYIGGEPQIYSVAAPINLE